MISRSAGDPITCMKVKRDLAEAGRVEKRIASCSFSTDGNYLDIIYSLDSLVV